MITNLALITNKQLQNIRTTHYRLSEDCAVSNRIDNSKSIFIASGIYQGISGWMPAVWQPWNALGISIKEAVSLKTCLCWFVRLGSALVAIYSLQNFIQLSGRTSGLSILWRPFSSTCRARVRLASFHFVAVNLVIYFPVSIYYDAVSIYSKIYKNTICYHDQNNAIKSVVFQTWCRFIIFNILLYINILVVYLIIHFRMNLLNIIRFYLFGKRS